MNTSVLVKILLFVCLINLYHSLSLLQAYNDAKWSRRRQGMLNTRFTPVAHQRGDDDWQKQLGQARVVGKIMDENEIGLEVMNPINDRINDFFNRGSQGRGALGQRNFGGRR
ncbi:unnamed protein product, partial [Mesorhabditis belari]|uniref:Uncharacterized protein n=1 Tax=Mesorhabditis belari TaxID=2138241 RepID=A0AAF3FIF4_9BILA